MTCSARCNPPALDQEPGHPLVAHVSGDEDAYLDLAQVKALAEQVWRFLDVPVPTGKVDYSWDRKSKTRGSALRSYSSQERAQVALAIDEYNRRAKAFRAQQKRGEFSADEVVALKELAALVKKRQAALGAPKVDDMRFGLRMSRIIAEEVPPAERAVTVIHEACHIAAYVLYGATEDVGHGPKWQALMTRCGLPPRQYAQAVASLSIVVDCPGCGNRSGVTPKLAMQLRDGGSFRCGKCKTPVTADHMSVPEHLEKKVQAAAVKRGPKVWVECPCGAVTPLPPKQTALVHMALDNAVRAGLPPGLGRGEVKTPLRCPTCYKPVLVGAVKGATPWTIPWPPPEAK